MPSPSGGPTFLRVLDSDELHRESIVVSLHHPDNRQVGARDHIEERSQPSSTIVLKTKRLSAGPLHGLRIGCSHRRDPRRDHGEEFGIGVPKIPQPLLGVIGRNEGEDGTLLAQRSSKSSSVVGAEASLVIRLTKSPLLRTRCSVAVITTAGSRMIRPSESRVPR